MTDKEKELKVKLALLQAAAIISAGTSIGTKSDPKPNEVSGLVNITMQIWERIDDFPGLVVSDEDDEDMT
jgi:hypothetical protein